MASRVSRVIYQQSLLKRALRPASTTVTPKNVSIRSFSKVAAPGGTESRPLSTVASSCPVTGRTSNNDSNEKGAKDQQREQKQEHPELVNVAALPFVGSTVPQYSGTPEMGDGRDYDFWMGMRKKFGDFYTMGMPGLGNGVYGTLNVLTDPREMAKVIRSEGKFPSGVLQMQWALRKHLNDIDSPLTRGEQDGIFGQSTDWKRQRTFLQTDLLNPKAAAGYVDGVLAAAELASKGASSMGSDLNKYLNHCAFDMFSTILFGELVQSADPNVETGPENKRFVITAAESLSINNTLNSKPYELLMGSLGIQTQLYKKMIAAFDEREAIGLEKIDKFMEQKNAGNLNELQKKSWLAHAIERQLNDGSDVSYEEMTNLAGTMLGAAVDTTSGLLSWTLLHVGLNPELQERLYDEITTAIQESGGTKLSVDILKKNSMPLLHATVRETHRLTPNAPVAMFKRVADEVEIHGQTFPAGTMFMFEGFSTGRDPTLVDDADSFIPDRWLADRVKARKGTPKEIIDNTFFKEPFSQGARRCPGSRVANNEVLAMLAQLVLDWKITVPDVSSYKEVTYSLKGTVAPDLPEMKFDARS